MDVQKIAEGLWRWTAPHPDWKPDNDTPSGWPQMVGCVYYEPSRAEMSVVLFDPLAPQPGTVEAERFWKALEKDGEAAGRPVSILVGNEYHSRSAQDIHDRFRQHPGAALRAHRATVAILKFKVTDPFEDGDILPGGIVVHGIPSLSEGEVAFYVPEHRAVVFADAILGAGGGKVRVAPPSWAPNTPEGHARYEREFRSSLRKLLDHPIDKLLVSHGPPVLEAGRGALMEALETPAWGQ